jgi:hypothetical protein
MVSSKPCGGDEGDARAFALQHGVGADGGAVAHFEVREWMGHGHLRCGRRRLRATGFGGFPPIRQVREWMGHGHLRCGRRRLRATGFGGFPPIRGEAANGRGTGTCGAADGACAPRGSAVSRPFAKCANGWGTGTCGAADGACAPRRSAVSRPSAKCANGWGTGTCGAADGACAPRRSAVSRPFAVKLRMDGARSVGG